MEIIRTDKEPRYMKVNVSDLPAGSCFESDGKLVLVRVNHAYDAQIHLIFLNDNTIWKGPKQVASIKFSDAILCDVKIIYERVLE